MDAECSGEKANSRSACSGKGVGVSNTNVSTIEPFDEPNDTLKKKKKKQFKKKCLTQLYIIAN